MYSSISRVPRRQDTMDPAGLGPSPLQGLRHSLYVEVGYTTTSTRIYCGHHKFPVGKGKVNQAKRLLW